MKMTVLLLLVMTMTEITMIMTVITMIIVMIITTIVVIIIIMVIEIMMPTTRGMIPFSHCKAACPSAADPECGARVRRVSRESEQTIRANLASATETHPPF